MEIALLILSVIVLVIAVFGVVLAVKTYASVHVMVGRQVEDPTRVQESIGRIVDQRVSSMEENLIRVENDQQETTRKHNDQLNEYSNKLLAQKIDTMSMGITTILKSENTNVTAVLKTENAAIAGILKADREHNTALLDGNAKALSSGLENLNKTMETRLAKLTETLTSDFSKMRAENNQQIEKIRETVNEKLDKTLNEQFDKSFKGVLTQMTELQKTMGELKGISNQVGSLEKTLNGVKTRGIMGEVQLKQIIADVLTPQQYDVEVATKPGSDDHVEIAIRMPLHDGSGFVYLPIDSKCHLDRYESLIRAYDSSEKDAISRAKKDFIAALREDAHAIADKYISVPDTTPYAILFVPFEGMYSEIVNLNMIDELIHMNITVAGPYTLMAILSTVTNYFQALAIEQKSQEIERTLGRVKKEFGNYEMALKKVRKSLDAASNNLEVLQTTRTNAMNRALRGITEMEQGLLPEDVSRDDSYDVADEEFNGDPTFD